MPNTPTYILYHGKATGKDRSGKKIWTRIGAAWPIKSGTGFSITLEYQPLADGIIRPIRTITRSYAIIEPVRA
ncbi:hypothetical protein HYZ98_01800 [Candidatus Peregrinibacteria bacterium]|nr:hypothetical protein [Candidatus Peregrinibacteria bacterium]